MGLAEAVILLKEGDLIGVLAVGDLGHLVEPVRHGLAVLLLDGREVARAVGVGGHGQDSTFGRG